MSTEALSHISNDRRPIQHSYLLKLPSEIIEEIVSYLYDGHKLHIDDWAAHETHTLEFPSTSLYALSNTCRLLYNYAEPTLKRTDLQIKKLLELRSKRTFEVHPAIPRPFGTFSHQYQLASIISRRGLSSVSLPKEVREKLIDDLLILERWPAYNPTGQHELFIKWNLEIDGEEDSFDRFASKLAPQNFYLCTFCLRLRCVNKFLKSQVSDRRKKWPNNSKQAHEAHLRICIDCGVKDRGVFKKGKVYRFFEDDKQRKLGFGIVCDRCAKWHICKDGNESQEALTKTCTECLKYRPKGRASLEPQNRTFPRSGPAEPE